MASNARKTLRFVFIFSFSAVILAPVLGAERAALSPVLRREKRQSNIIRDSSTSTTILAVNSDASTTTAVQPVSNPVSVATPFVPPPVACLDVCAMTFLKNCPDGMLCVFDFATCRPSCIEPPVGPGGEPTTTRPTISIDSTSSSTASTRGAGSTTVQIRETSRFIPPSAPCINLCKINFCANYMRCRFDPSTCRTKCYYLPNTPPVVDVNGLSSTTAISTTPFTNICGNCVEGMCAFFLKYHRYKCACFEGFFGDRCSQVCNLRCGDFEHCAIDDDGEMVCRQGLNGVIPAFLRNHTVIQDLQKQGGPRQIDRNCGFCLHGECEPVPEIPEGFTCSCYANYSGKDCSKYCNLTCENGGKCVVLNIDMLCDCHPNFTGPLCNETRLFNDTLTSSVIQVHSTPDWLWYIVTACILLIVLLIVLAVVMPFYLWKHRNILILKIVYYLKPYEDDDEKKYDAFISFKGRTEDEAFVYRTLALRLENEMNFKLCLHDRDFIPGEYISDQIIDAIDNSRRTILILSPDYCNSEWTKFEYHRAREEMLRNKTRIIPIMYKDISSIEDIDPTLNEILKSITYITWPGFANDVASKQELEALDDKKARKEEEKRQKDEERFWRKVHLTMPKKHKISPSEPSPNYSCTVPLSPISNGKINASFSNNDVTSSVPLPGVRTNPDDLSEISVVVTDKKNTYKGGGH